MTRNNLASFLEIEPLRCCMSDSPSPFPVSVVSHRSRGRELKAVLPICRGSVAVRCLPLALVPADAQLRLRCAACLSALERCEPCSCGYALCGACRDGPCWLAVHSAGECVSLRHLWALLKRTPGDAGNADSSAARLLIRLAYLQVTVVPAATGCPRGDALSDEAESLDELLSHFDELSEVQTQHAYDLADTVRWCLVARARSSRERLAQLAAKLWCNCFDVVDAESGASIGEGLYPSLAICVNHSCAPNADFQWEEGNRGALSIRTLRDVAAGEKLSIAYCSLFASTTSRRRHLRSTYFFDCRCRRCARRDGAPHVLPLAKRALETAASAVQDAGVWPQAALAACELEAAVAPLVAAGADWARLTLCRARWTRLRGSGGSGSAALEALGDELDWLLGTDHTFTRKVHAFGVS